MDTNIQKYLAFLKTVEYKSFTKAAESLNYTQSGVSRMVAGLEKEWGLALLERDRGGLELTSDGLRLLPYVRNICDDYRILQTEIDDINELRTGLIRIGSVLSVSSNLLPDIIGKFQKVYPNVEYELLNGDYKEIERWIREGRVDCGFLQLPTCEEFEVIELESDPIVAVLPPGHPLTAKDTVTLEELCSDPFILMERGEKSEVRQMFEQANLQPDIRFTTWDDYAMMSMVEKGMGISATPGLILKKKRYNIEIRTISSGTRRTLGVAIKNRRKASLAVRRFLEFVE